MPVPLPIITRGSNHKPQKYLKSINFNEIVLIIDNYDAKNYK